MAEQTPAISGESRALRAVIERIPKLAQVDAPLLLTGESGTGKELFARAVHYASQRASGPFVPLNCASLPEALVESELFGHVRGAYTGATSDESGLVAEADGGTLFLDEIDALSLPVQAKLLRFLQDTEYRRLGDPTRREGNIRILSATNANLRESIEERTFRQDLLFRLDVLRLHLPPLRERTGDVELLAIRFLRRHAASYARPARDLSARALAALADRPWPGNVRELEATILRAVLLSDGSLIDLDDLELDGSGASPSQSLREARSRALETFETNYLEQLLARHEGNVSHAAAAAGTDRRVLQRLMRKHRIDRQRFVR